MDDTTGDDVQHTFLFKCKKCPEVTMSSKLEAKEHRRQHRREEKRLKKKMSRPGASGVLESGSTCGAESTDFEDGSTVYRHVGPGLPLPPRFPIQQPAAETPSIIGSKPETSRRRPGPASKTKPAMDSSRSLNETPDSVFRQPAPPPKRRAGPASRTRPEKEVTEPPKTMELNKDNNAEPEVARPESPKRTGAKRVYEVLTLTSTTSNASSDDVENTSPPPAKATKPSRRPNVGPGPAVKRAIAEAAIRKCAAQSDDSSRIRSFKRDAPVYQQRFPGG